MWSRRKFIFSILTSYAFWSNYQNDSALALYKKGGHTKFDPRLIGAEYWPPAISCNFIDVFGDNLCCMADDLGRLATADILTAIQHSHIYPILGEINSLGNKVLFLKVIQPQLALIITQKQIDKNATVKDRHNKKAERTDTQDNQFICYLVNLASPQAPHIVSTTVISNYSQLSAFAVSNIKNRPVLCLSGLDYHGDNRISFYGLKGERKITNSFFAQTKRGG